MSHTWSHFKRTRYRCTGTARQPPSFVPIIARARRKTRADKAERGRGRGTRPDRTGHDQTRQQQGSAAPASRAAVRTDGGHVRVSLVEFGFIFRLVKFLGLFIGVL